MAENYTLGYDMYTSEEQVVPLGNLPTTLTGTLCSENEADYYYFDNIETEAQTYVVDIDTIELGSDAQVSLRIFHESDYPILG